MKGEIDKFIIMTGDFSASFQYLTQLTKNRKSARM